VNRLSELVDAKVVAEDGTVLGHVFEIRSPGAAETEPQYRERIIDCLLCGRQGLLERLGWKEPRAFRIPWSAVLAVDDRAVRVRGNAGDYQAQGS
jgi:sporulation protein YlmC with PRC-barrel domain